MTRQGRDARGAGANRILQCRRRVGGNGTTSKVGMKLDAKTVSRANPEIDIFVSACKSNLHESSRYYMGLIMFA